MLTGFVKLYDEASDYPNNDFAVFPYSFFSPLWKESVGTSAIQSYKQVLSDHQVPGIQRYRRHMRLKELPL